MKPVTLNTLRQMKQASEKIVCLTAYDYSFAGVLDRAGIDLVMVGDSLGMVMQGHDSTLPVSLEDMAYHAQCVARGCRRAFRVVDMPFGTFQITPEEAMANAIRLMQEGAAHCIKLEGGAPMLETVRFLVERGVEEMTPPPLCA